MGSGVGDVVLPDGKWVGCKLRDLSVEELQAAAKNFFGRDMVVAQAITSEIGRRRQRSARRFARATHRRPRVFA